MDNGVSSPSQVRKFLGGGDPRVIAPLILGAVLTHNSEAGPVSVRLTEVEAYMGPRDSEHPDPGSHTFGGPTARNAPMFGPPGFLYVYFTYGMHYCATSSAVLTAQRLRCFCGQERLLTGMSSLPFAGRPPRRTRTWLVDLPGSPPRWDSRRRILAVTPSPHRSACGCRRRRSCRRQWTAGGRSGSRWKHRISLAVLD